MASRLGLGHRQPVAVQVEVIVIGASARPGLVVLGRERVGGGLDPVGDLELMDEAVASIGILGGNDDDQRFGEDLFHHRIVHRREKVIRGQKAGVGRRDLVAVNPIREPGDGGLRFDESARFRFGRLPRLGEPFAVRADLVEPRDIGLRPRIA